jgi:hypothetical protein
VKNIIYMLKKMFVDGEREFGIWEDQVDKRGGIIKHGVLKV